MNKFLLLFSFIYFISVGQDQTIKYVSLGDSYTIGTGINSEDAWPNLLVKDLNKAGLKTELVANPAKNGYTTQDLIDEELAVAAQSGADFVTVLIGVNDWVRGYSSQTFHDNLVKILDFLQKNLQNKPKILLITIPDFGVTPTGKYYAKGRNISQGISEFNNIIKSEAKSRNLPCADIFEISKQMGLNSELVASDGLHPSAKEYLEWEKIIFPEAKKLLSK
jgi:lysophospholipase L1-like esterase